MRADDACGMESLEAAAVTPEFDTDGKAAGKFASQGGGAEFEVNDEIASRFANDEEGTAPSLVAR
jgi:hypothetical protein